MNPNIEKEFAKAKKAQAKYEQAKEWFVKQLPESVQSTYHYDGLTGIGHWYPEYYKYLKELK